MTASIKQFIEKIKHLYTHVPIELLFGIIVVLVGVSAFSIGRVSALSELRQSQVQLHTDNTLPTIPQVHIGGAVVASKKGKRYHYPWCPGAQKMSEHNKRWFKSIEEARAAGYTPAGNCKGLK